MKRIILASMAFIIAVTAVAQERKYSIKSGVMKTVTNVLGQKAEGTLFFDDYGNLECSQNKTVQNGIEKVEMSVISRDGKMHIVHHTLKQIQEIPLQESINYLNLTPEIVKKYNIQELGREMVLDKECIKYSAETSQAGETASVIVWVWQGITLKTITSSGGLSITVETIDLQVDTIHDPKIFEIPSF